MTKSNMMAKLAPLAALVLGTVSHAGEGGGIQGGGGASIVCFDSPEVVEQIRRQDGLLTDDQIDKHVTSIEAYDLAQARAWKVFGAPDPFPMEMLPGEKAEQYIERLAARFDHTVPGVSRLVRDALANLRAASMITAAQGVAQRRDAAEVLTWDPVHCTLITSAYQYEHGDQGRVIALDMRLLDHPLNSEMSRAYLYLHEGIYSIARARGQKDSRFTRDLISIIVQTRIQDTAGKLKKRLIGLGLVGPGDPITINEDVVVREEKKLLEHAKKLATRYDRHNAEIFRQMRKEQTAVEIRKAIEIGAAVPTIGLLMFAYMAFDPCDAFLDDASVAWRCSIPKHQYYFDARQEW